MLINKDQLKKALLEWEKQARAGVCMPAEEALKLPVEEIAQRNTDALWTELSK